MSASEVSRRTLLKTAAWGAAGATLNLGAIGRALAAGDLTVGIVYVGARDDFGWNQAHAVAAEALKLVPGRQGRRGRERSRDRRLRQDDGIDDQSRRRRADPGDLVRLLHAVRRRHGQEISERRVPPCRAAVEQGQGSEERRQLFRLSQPGPLRRTASRPGLCTKSNKIGFVAAKPIASVLSNINSVLLGARKTNPKAIVQVIFTGDWSMPVREAEAANALVDAGCDVITCHVDRPRW